MTKILKTDASTIESIRLMTMLGNDIKPVIRGICATHILTDEFIQEFHRDIDSSMFSTSFMLSDEMANKYPEFFVDDIFRKHFINGENVFINSEDENNDSGDEDYDKNILKRSDNVDISMVIRYISEYTDLLNKNKDIAVKSIIKIIRNTSVEKLDIPTCISLMGFSNEIDSVLLKRVQDESIRNQILLTLSIDNDENNISAVAYKYMGNDMKENSIGTEDVPFKDFVRVISQSKDIGWVSSMIDKAVSGEIEIMKNSDCDVSDFLTLIGNINESHFVKLSKLADKVPTAFSYKIMQWVLINKYFNEEELLAMKDIFKRAGCIFQLKKLANDSGYDTLYNSI